MGLGITAMQLRHCWHSVSLKQVSTCMQHMFLAQAEQGSSFGSGAQTVGLPPVPMPPTPIPPEPPEPPRPPIPPEPPLPTVAAAPLPLDAPPTPDVVMSPPLPEEDVASPPQATRMATKPSEGAAKSPRFMSILAE